MIFPIHKEHTGRCVLFVVCHILFPCASIYVEKLVKPRVILVVEHVEDMTPLILVLEDLCLAWGP